ncbi:MAG: hypothetical protein ACWA44_02480 [Thiotrichales bacterium]
MLVPVIETTVFAALTGFCVVYGVKMFDFLLDYNQYFWRIRYKLARRAAAGDEALLQDLSDSLSKAKDSGDEKANVMADCYNRVADSVYRFKLWTCIYCMAIRLAAYVVPTASVLLVAQGYGFYTLVYAIGTMAFASLFLRL